MTGRGWYRAHPPRKVSTLASQKAASRKSAVGEQLESDSACAVILLLFSLSLFRGGVFKAREMGSRPLLHPPYPRFVDFLALSLSLSLALQAELGRRGFSLLMASSFSRGLKVFFFLGAERSCAVAENFNCRRLELGPLSFAHITQCSSYTESFTASFSSVSLNFCKGEILKKKTHQQKIVCACIFKTFKIKKIFLKILRKVFKRYFKIFLNILFLQF